MLRRHLDAWVDSHPNPAARLRARRRLARVYRSAARQLMMYGEGAPDHRTYVCRMLRTYPLEARNVAVALAWLAQSVRA